MTNWRDVLDEFLLIRRAEGLAERTLRDYRDHIPAFFKDAGDAWPDVKALRRAVLGHFEGLRGMSASYWNMRRKYLNAFFSWAVREGYLDDSPAKGIPKRKDEPQPRHVDTETLRKLLQLPDKRSYVGVRDLALLTLSLDTGVRPIEAFSLLPGDVDLRALEVRIPAANAKTRRERTLIISPETARAIRRLLTVRPDTWRPSVPLFANQDGRPLNRNSWAKRLRLYSRKLGAAVSPYSLRHSHAILFLRQGGNLFALMREMGHSDLNTTRRYVNLDTADRHEQHRLASPLGAVLPPQRAPRKAGGR
ncbi:tyrosine-type recombinase/integrase [Kyrpidia spormannii]|uniref:Integrase family protein n=1 Tax=Kyrpidia spormannii TaxID=2055160 RepID=A0ACA8Z893_9BACL|nr:site-specific integrase [Kyrpidia spormannii]CAB3391684.1 Integrase family protein [Kyrpidia spormannii]